MTDQHVVGGSTLRVDTIAKLTGQARYAEDMQMAGLLHARTVRCPHPHARLLALNVEPALRVPGVVRIITAQDVPGVNGFPEYSKDEPLLLPVGETAKMRGTPVAFVVATSRDAALKGVQAVEATWEPLPHLYDAEEALRPDAPLLYPQGNVLSTFSVAHGDLEAAFAASDVILETEYRTAFQEHSALEREAALGTIDEIGRVTVFCATHEPHWQQKWIAAALALDVEQVRVIVPPTGGSFGGKQDPWPLVAAGLLAYHLRGPVVLAFSRRESFDASPKRHPYHVRYRIGARADGTLTGIRVRITANTGGYDSAGYWIPNYAVTASGGPYRWQAVDAFAQTVFTNGPKCGQFRGYGTPQSTFALECTLDELCQRLGLDPLEFRLKNRLEQDAVSFLGYPIAERLGYAEVLEAIRPRYEAFKRDVEAFNAAAGNGPLRKGWGLSGMWYRFGKSGSLRVETHAELAADGHFVIYCSAPDYGQGTNTVMTQIAAEALGVPRECVEVINADTGCVPDSGVQGASRATYFVGTSVWEAARALKEAILATAAEMLDCAPTRLILTDGRVEAQGDSSRSVSLQSVAQEFDRIGRPRKLPGVFDLTPEFPDERRPEYTPHFVTAAHLAEVLVDTETGQVQVTRYVAVHDVGRAINPPDARGQIEGAVLMGIGAALREEYLPGLTNGFTDYILPTIDLMPEVETILVEVPSFRGVLGVKGVGETAMLPSTPAVINALSRAIGARIRTIPATPERVLAALRHQGSRD